MYMWGESLVLIMIMIFKLINCVFVYLGLIVSFLINVFNCWLIMIIGGIFIFIGCVLMYFVYFLNVVFIIYGIIVGKWFFFWIFCVGMKCEVYMYIYVFW